MRRRDFIALAAATAASGSVAAHGQPSPKPHRLAIVVLAGPVDMIAANGHPRSWRPFFKELHERGYQEGQNLFIERYSGNARQESLWEVAREVVAAHPDVIFAITGRMAAQLKAATTSIPIVAYTADPIALGIANSLAHPGENLTGVVVDAGAELDAKRFQLIRETKADMSAIGYLAPRGVWESGLVAALQKAAPQIGARLLPALVESPSPAEYRNAFRVLAEQSAEGLVVADAQENYRDPRLIIELAENARLPALYPERRFVEQGGLMAYGADYPDLYRQAARYIDQVLTGANPGEIPFYRSTRFELVINLKTAKLLGLTVPPTLLARADEVIE